MLPADLVAILVCPTSQQRLIYFPRGESDRSEADGFLLCPSSAMRYRVTDGVPVMLPEEAERLSSAQVEQLVSRARQLGLTIPA